VPVTLVQAAALVFAGAACVIDLRDGRIPNLLTFGAIIVAFVVHGFLPQGNGLAHVGLGMLVGLAMFFPFFALGGMGAGDVKLMAAIGAWLGPMLAVLTALYGAVAGGVLAIGIALSRGYLKTAFSNLRRMIWHWRVNGLEPVPELTLEHNQGPRLAYALPIFIGLLVTLWRTA
jgi:prepilin peptidase CpaA